MPRVLKTKLYQRWRQSIHNPTDSVITPAAPFLNKEPPIVGYRKKAHWRGIVHAKLHKQPTRETEAQAEKSIGQATASRPEVDMRGRSSCKQIIAFCT